jgi:predicted alpha/beta-hydrolase family hydrolase
MRLTIALLLLLASATCFAQPDYARDGNNAPDYAREKRWADEISPSLVVGDAVYLTQKSGHRFLAIYAEVPQSRGAVIVVHGLGVHPDWALIGALRAGLAEQGYSTLSAQMPVLAADVRGDLYPPLFPDAAERLQAAVVYLRSKGHRKIAIASHSMGARMTNFFLTSAPENGVAAWISIGVSSGEFAAPGRLNLPVLDIYGERDLPQVLKSAGARAVVLKKLKGSAQIEVAGADHYFAGHERELVKQAKLFLDQRLR